MDVKKKHICFEIREWARFEVSADGNRIPSWNHIYPNKYRSSRYTFLRQEANTSKYTLVGERACLDKSSRKCVYTISSDSSCRLSSHRMYHICSSRYLPRHQSKNIKNHKTHARYVSGRHTGPASSRRILRLCL